MSRRKDLPPPQDRKQLVEQIRADAIWEWRNAERQSWYGKWTTVAVGVVGAVVGATAAGIAAASLSAGWAAGLAALAGAAAALQTHFRPGEQRIWHAHQAAAYRTIVHEADLLLLSRDDELSDEKILELLKTLQEQTQTKLDHQLAATTKGDQPGSKGD